MFEEDIFFKVKDFYLIKVKLKSDINLIIKVVVKMKKCFYIINCVNKNCVVVYKMFLFNYMNEIIDLK